MAATDDLIRQLKSELQIQIDAELKSLIAAPVERTAGKIQAFTKAQSLIADLARRHRIDGGDHD